MHSSDRLISYRRYPWNWLPSFLQWFFSCIHSAGTICQTYFWVERQWGLRCEEGQIFTHYKNLKSSGKDKTTKVGQQSPFHKQKARLRGSEGQKGQVAPEDEGRAEPAHSCAPNQLSFQRTQNYCWEEACVREEAILWLKKKKNPANTAGMTNTFYEWLFWFLYQEPRREGGYIHRFSKTLNFQVLTMLTLLQN